MAKAPTPAPVVEYGEPVVMGRKDYGAGVTGKWVTVDGERFVEYAGRLFVPCGHCEGYVSGSKWWAAHVLGGVCFQCGGRGYSKELAGGPEAAAKIAHRRNVDRARRERKAAEKQAAQAAAFTTWASEHAELTAKLTELAATFAGINDGTYDGPNPGLLYDFALQVAHGSKPLSVKQTELAERLIAEFTGEAEELAAVKATQRHAGEVGGKVTITGKVVVRRWIEATNYGWASSTLFVVEGTDADAGVTAKWFTSAQVDAEPGDTVEITGTVKAHEEYEGKPQTVLTRVKVKVLATATTTAE